MENLSSGQVIGTVYAEPQRLIHMRDSNLRQVEDIRRQLTCVGEEYDLLHRQLLDYKNAEEYEADVLSRAIAAENALAEERVMREVETEKLKTELKKQTDDRLFFEDLAKANEEILEVEKKLKEEAQARLEKISEEKLQLDIEIVEFKSMLDEIQRKQKVTQSIVMDMTLKRSQMRARMTRRFTMLSHSELIKATNDFHPLLKIGNSFYRARMWHMPVAVYRNVSSFTEGSIMVTHPGLRHRHLLSPIGGCQDPPALVFEYLPGGNLKDRLQCKDDTPPLDWQARRRIVTEICSALIFLHGAGTANCFLRDFRVTLDANFTAKIMSCALKLNDILSCQRNDIIQLGIIILQLLTGFRPWSLAFEKLTLRMTKRPKGAPNSNWETLKKNVEKAVETKNLKEAIVDQRAGECPEDLYFQLAKLCLQCWSTSNQPLEGLKSHIQGIISSMKRASSVATTSHQQSQQYPREPPSYFICPISQEIMQEPCMAADGFTYEREELLKWFNQGHKTSPMTNIELTHLNLTPNHALRSAIQEWLMDSVE